MMVPERQVRIANPAPHGPGSEGRGSPRAGEVLGVDPAAQYAVLLLNEEQMANLLHRPSMRVLDQRFAPVNVAFDGYARLMRRARIAMAVLLLIGAGAGAWAWAPLPVLAAFPWTSAEAPPPMATGASFSLTIASPPSADTAVEMSRRMAAAGTPSFVRAATAAHHVMVGPFVSLDEAEAEQQRFGGSRVFVDDSLRKASPNPPVAAHGNPAMVLVGAGAQHALVLEFTQEPHQVSTKRGADGTVVVEMGPIDSDVETQAWSAPAGVSLLRQVKVEEIAGSAEARHARATLTMPRSTMARARVDGRRVYIDLLPAPPPPPPAPAAAVAPAPQPVARQAIAAPKAASAAPAVASPVEAAPSAAPPRPPAGESLRPVVARFERLVPFLQSATRTAAPDVLRALASNVDELERILREATPSPETADARGALSSALASARRAVDAGFTGDRVAEAHQAGMLVEAAKTVLPVTPAQ
jgi:hypothetical protein